MAAMADLLWQIQVYFVLMGAKNKTLQAAEGPAWTQGFTGGQ